MRAGPKGSIKVDPLDLDYLPAGRAARRIKFIEDFCIVPKGRGAGDPVVLRPFQKEIIRGAFAPKVRTGLVSLPRGNGKTALAAMLAVAELFAGDASAEVLVVASDHRQAMLTLRMAKRMIELNPLLLERAHIYQDRIVVPHTDSTLVPLPADPGALHGWDPSLLIVDELHVVTEQVWEAVTSATGKRPESLTLAISTPASSPDSIMWKLVEHGRSGEDRAFFIKEFAAPDGCATDDRKAWRIANPALACRPPFLTEDGIEAVRRTLREPAFRQLRLGQWVSAHSAWLPFGVWDAVEDSERRVEPGERVVLGFDGSASGDSTALVGCTVEEEPHVFLVGLWEKGDRKDWKVPRGEVARAVDTAFDTWNVLELSADPWGWRSELESWAERHGEDHIIEFDTSQGNRMAPPTDRMYQAIVDRRLTQDGNPDMAKHFAHAVAERTSKGDVIRKDKKTSPRKIDAAIAAIVALERSQFHAQQKTTHAYAAF